MELTRMIDTLNFEAEKFVRKVLAFSPMDLVLRQHRHNSPGGAGFHRILLSHK